MRLAGALALAGLVVTTSAEATTIARVTLPQMERSSTVVFVGEFVTGTRAPLGGFPGRRYHFRVQRLLHGGPSEHVQLFVPDFAGLSLGVRPGANYLVFAERRRFGRGKEERLTATGYYQGVYRVFARGRAANSTTARSRSIASPRGSDGARTTAGTIRCPRSAVS